MSRLLCCLALIATCSLAEGQGQLPGPSPSPSPQEVEATCVKLKQIRRTAGFVIVQIGDARNSRDMQLQIDKRTRFSTADGKVLSDGLHHTGFREGAEVLIVTGTGSHNRTIVEMQLLNPTPGMPLPHGGGRQ